MRQKRTWQERFHEKVDRSGGPDACWDWLGAKDRNGYGVFLLDGKIVRAHRVSLSIATGRIPRDRFALHACDRPSCVAPHHLRWGDAFQNAIDKSERGRNRPRRGTQCGNSRLSAEQVHEARRRLRRGEDPRLIAEALGVGRHVIIGIHPCGLIGSYRETIDAETLALQETWSEPIHASWRDRRRAALRAAA